MYLNINDRTPLPIGYYLHEYRIESILGKGHLSITYLALNMKLNYKVIIQEYFPCELAIRLSNQHVEASSDDKIENYKVGLKEFIKNNHILAQLKHHHIARVLELFESHNTSYLVIKYEPGQTLAEILEKVGMLTHSALIKLLLPLISALTVVHKSGLWHLNISPANIYLREKDQSPFLFNFGGASKCSESLIEISNHTPFEQYENSNTQKICTDIYALGAVLYHAISGKPPIDFFQRKALLLQGEPDPLSPISKINTEKHYSKNLLEGIDWALAIDHKDRPQIFVQWATFILSDSQQQVFLFPQSTQRIIMISIVIIAVIATGFGLKYFFYTKKPVTDGNPIENIERIETKELNNNKILLSLLKQPPHPAQIVQSIALPMQEMFSLHGHDAGICVEACIAFSPDGQLLASGSWDHTIKLWDVATGNLLQTLQGHQDLVLSITFSPNGSLLASSSADNTIKLWNVSTGKPLQTLKENWVSSLAFSPDGKILAAEGDHNSIKLWELSSGSLLQTLVGHENVINSIRFSPDGLFIASGSADGNIKLWEVNSGHLLQTFIGQEILAIAFSPDGLFLASGDVASQIKLWDIKNGKLEKTLKGHKNWVLSVTFSPDGRLLASGSHDHTIKLWNIQDGKLLETLTVHNNDVNAIAFSPDGSIFASGSRDKTIKLWHHL